MNYNFLPTKTYHFQHENFFPKIVSWLKGKLIEKFRVHQMECSKIVEHHAGDDYYFNIAISMSMSGVCPVLVTALEKMIWWWWWWCLTMWPPGPRPTEYLWCNPWLGWVLAGVSVTTIHQHRTPESVSLSTTQTAQNLTSTWVPSCGCRWAEVSWLWLLTAAL